MPLQRKRTRNADSIVISSSPDTSEASEENTPESDIDDPSKHGGYAAESGMSERQTRKINSGRFGMFNRPRLTPSALLRTPNLSKKRRRTVKEYSTYQERPRSSRRTERKGGLNSDAIKLDCESEEEQSLFIPDNTSQTNPVTVEEGSEDEQHLYNGMTAERAERAKEYINTLSLAEEADKRMQTAQEKLDFATNEHTTLSRKLATIDAMAENRISDIIRQTDEAIRIANEHAQEQINCVRARLPAKKESYDKRLQECGEQMRAAEECIAEVKADLDGAKKRKEDLEHHGGFELCSDVREVQVRVKTTPRRA